MSGCDFFKDERWDGTIIGKARNVLLRPMDRPVRSEDEAESVLKSLGFKGFIRGVEKVTVGKNGIIGFSNYPWHCEIIDGFVNSNKIYILGYCADMNFCRAIRELHITADKGISPMISCAYGEWSDGNRLYVARDLQHIVRVLKAAGWR